jgi:hypothetical protein
MPTAKEIATAIALLSAGRPAAAVGRAAGAAITAGRAARAEQVAFQALSRRAQLQAAATTGLRAGKFVGRHAVTKNPYGVAAFLVYEGYVHRDDLHDVAVAIGEGAIDIGDAGGALIRGEDGTAAVSTRKVSKANKAVKHAMGLLKAGTKRSTGADKGKLTKGAFKIAVKAAGLANPNTKSKIGVGKTITKALARKLKQWWK